MFEDEKEEA